MVTLESKYNSRMQRVWRSENGTAEKLIYDSQKLIAEAMSTGTALNRYYLSEGGSVYSPLLAQLGSEHWFLFDVLGTTLGLTSPTGSLTDTFKYEAFGTSLGRTGTTATPYQYVGGYGYFNEPNVGLEQVWHRWLQQPSGCWLSADLRKIDASRAFFDIFTTHVLSRIGQPMMAIPLRESRGMYNYVANAPTQALDVDGQIPIWLVIVGAIGLLETICIGWAVADGYFAGMRSSYKDKMAHCVASCDLMACDLGLGLVSWLLGWFKEIIIDRHTDSGDVAANALGRRCWRCRTEETWGGITTKETCEHCCERML